MNKKIFSTLTALVVIFGSVVASISNGQAKQTSAATATSVAAQDPLMSLPASDVVMSVDIKRILTEALPRALAADQTKFSQVKAELERVKARTGIDLYAFDRIAVGTHFINSGNITRGSTVAIMRGRFDAASIVATARLASKGRYHEEKYNGKTVYTFRLDEQFKLFGLPGFRVNDLGLTTLDANTLVIGNPVAVRAAIDASAGRGRVSNDLILLATRNPNALIGFGSNLSPDLKQNLNLGNDEVSKNISYIEQVYGSIGMTANGYDLLTIARTQNKDQAAYLRDTVSGLKGLGSIVINSRLSGERARIAQSALDNLKVTADDRELQISMALSQKDFETILNTF